MLDSEAISTWLRRLAPHIVCGKCCGPVDGVDLQRNPLLSYWVFEIRCHGKRQVLRVPFEALPLGELRKIVLFEPKKRKKKLDVA